MVTIRRTHSSTPFLKNPFPRNTRLGSNILRLATNGPKSSLFHSYLSSVPYLASSIKPILPFYLGSIEISVLVNTQ